MDGSNTVNHFGGNHYSIGRDQYNMNIAAARWISPLNFRASQLGFIEKRQAGTGKWFLTSPKFVDWRDGESKTLWCRGIPGSGKTILASIAVEHLEAHFKTNDDVAVACIYFNYKEQNVQTTSKLIGSLLRQLVEDQTRISNHVQSLYEHHTNRSTNPTLDEFIEVLQLELVAFSKVFVVLDALDECKGYESAGLLQRLLSLGRSLHLMVTSCNIPYIRQHLQMADCLDIQSQAEDVKMYVESRINAAPMHIQEWKTIIVNKVVKNAAEMFLMAKLHMDWILKMHNTHEIQNAIENLPKRVDDTYKEAMIRIEKQPYEAAQLAKNILSWVIHALQPLSVQELQHALAVELKTAKLDPNKIT